MKGNAARATELELSRELTERGGETRGRGSLRLRAGTLEQLEGGRGKRHGTDEDRPSGLCDGQDGAAPSKQRKRRMQGARTCQRTGGSSPCVKKPSWRWGGDDGPQVAEGRITAKGGRTFIAEGRGGTDLMYEANSAGEGQVAKPPGLEGFRGEESTGVERVPHAIKPSGSSSRIQLSLS